MRFLSPLAPVATIVKKLRFFWHRSKSERFRPPGHSSQLSSARQGSGGQPTRLGGYGEPSQTPDLRSVSLSLASLPLAGRSSEKKNFESSAETRRWTRPLLVV
ncbi:hypothetical protein MHYP_G00039190 [Metynnis hypsauchen]